MYESLNTISGNAETNEVLNSPPIPITLQKAILSITTSSVANPQTIENIADSSLRQGRLSLLFLFSFRAKEPLLINSFLFLDK